MYISAEGKKLSIYFSIKKSLVDFSHNTQLHTLFRSILPKWCWKTRLFFNPFSMVSIAALSFKSLVTSLLILACSSFQIRFGSQKLELSRRCSDRPNARFGRTVWPNFYCAVWPKWQNFFLQNTELFLYYIQCQWHPFIFFFCLMTLIYALLSLVFR